MDGWMDEGKHKLTAPQPQPQHSRESLTHWMTKFEIKNLRDSERQRREDAGFYFFNFYIHFCYVIGKQEKIKVCGDSVY